ncbi:hypothetical protein Lalb_Chr06g0170531 [Lupinus albus]|uniref:Uncharacterized protein n=1 Tax=Lupinus albus TaxID=3870 RepID=A0A6A4QEI0_LUPAL|nr:hypothetical protein Lalb_Chr06g0170531 [Lupinus albus]
MSATKKVFNHIAIFFCKLFSSVTLCCDSLTKVNNNLSEDSKLSGLISSKPSFSDDNKGISYANASLIFKTFVPVSFKHDRINLQVITPAKRLSVELDLDLPESSKCLHLCSFGIYHCSHISEIRHTQIGYHRKTYFIKYG